MRAYGAINLRQVPIRLRDQFHAVCALRGTSMTRRLIQLIEADVERAIDDGTYLPVPVRPDEAARSGGEAAVEQRELFPEHALPEQERVTIRRGGT